MNNPIISVIIPVYNAEKYIARCAGSLFRQTMADIEYIFVDDCGSDNSCSVITAVLEHFPHRKGHVKIIHHPHNMGVAQARMTGVKAATGKYIGLCDSDDWVDEQMYEKMYHQILKENASVCLCDILMYYSEKGSQIYHCPRTAVSHTEFLQSYIASVWTSTCNLLAERSLYSRHDIMPPAGTCYCEDFWNSFRLLYFSDKVTKVEEPLYVYNRENTGSFMHTSNTQSEKHERMVYMETIQFLKDRNDFEPYKKEMYWRVIKSTFDSILYPSRHGEFLNICPESHAYIMSCPFLNMKMKIIAWTLVHHLRFMTLIILKLRKLLGR